MGQYFKHLLNILFLIAVIGCDESIAPAPSTKPTTQPTRIVSLTPAGSNMIMAMGLTESLVGVSAYDSDHAVQKLPKVGDYQRIDWEQIAGLHATQLFMQGKRDRLQPGIEEHSKALGIQVNILQIDRLDDIYSAIDQIGKAVDNTSAATLVISELKSKLIQYPGRPVPAIIMIGGEGKLIVGRDNYLNDLLELAGGTNVIVTNGYISIDLEKAATLSPEVVFVLDPSGIDLIAKIPSVSSDNWPAIQNKRIFILSNHQALLPASCVTKVYDFFNQHLHPDSGASTQP